jgi:tetratricopeptide (TPR) repeat protein
MITIAWLALGICLWKKDNKNDARSCLLESIKQKPNKEALCELSILTRQIISKDQKLSTSIDESINLAKQAIQLDLSYHKSWYVLGNANCTRFFSVTQDISDLNKAFAAYKRAEILVNGDKNPDLYFTKGNVSRYLQHYDVALKSYQRSRELDESLAQVTDGPISEILTFQNRLYETFSEKTDTSLISKCRRDISSAPFTKGTVTLDKLQSGLNKKVIFAGVVIRLIPNGSDNMPPTTYLCMDASGTTCAVSLYNIGQNDNNLTNKVITIMDPLVIDSNLYKDNGKIISIEQQQNQSVFKSNVKTFKLLQVFYIQQLQINGQAIKNEQFAPTKLKLSTFDI